MPTVTDRRRRGVGWRDELSPSLASSSRCDASCEALCEASCEALCDASCEALCDAPSAGAVEVPISAPTLISAIEMPISAILASMSEERRERSGGGAPLGGGPLGGGGGLEGGGGCADHGDGGSLAGDGGAVVGAMGAVVGVGGAVVGAGGGGLAGDGGAKLPCGTIPFASTPLTPWAAPITARTGGAPASLWPASLVRRIPSRTVP